MMEENTTPQNQQVPQKPAPQKQPETKHEHRHPLEYVEESQLLLAYAAEQGMTINEAIVAVIVNSRYEIERDEWTSEREIKFWMAFDALAKLVYPVSIASLKATRTYGSHQTKEGKLIARRSPAERTVNTYQRRTWIILAILLIVQVYWLIGSVIITAVTKEIPAQIAILNKQIKALKENIIQAKREENELDAELLLEDLDRCQNEHKNLEDSKIAYYESLRQWDNARCVWIFCSLLRNGDYSARGYIETRQAAELVLQPLQLYFLPLLYGLLGASAYVLRNITQEIQNLTYTTHSNAQYRLRIELGSLAGLAVGWFLFVPTDTPNAGAYLSFRQLSPLALSFLAGYSVELVFAAMDKIVAAFSSEGSPKRPES